MDVSSINSDLIRGNVTTIILKALLTEDRYGYDILREIEVKSGGQYKLKQPTLYSCLKRLEKQGLINSYWGDESDTEGGRRRYYALSDSGRNYLVKMQSEYEYSRTILDSLLSEEKFDFENKEAPFDINSLRPYTKRNDEDDNLPKPQQSDSLVENYESNKQIKEENKPMFTPLDKGYGSYDNDNRHTKTSFSDMLGKIDDIIGNKQDNTSSNDVIFSKQEEVVETVSDNKPVETVQDDIKEEKIDAKSFFFEQKYVKQDVSQEEKERREAAKRALYSNEPIKKVEEKVDAVVENPQIETSTNDNLSARELLFGKQNNNTAPSHDYSDEHKNSAKIIFDKYNKTDDNVVEEKTEVKYDPKDVFYKYQQQNNNIVESNIETKISFDKPEIPENNDKTYKPEDIFDKYKKKDDVVEKKESTKITIEPSPVPPAATFSFRRNKDDIVDYREAFSTLRSTSNINDNRHEFGNNSQTSTTDLKTKLFQEGYNLRAYSRENTENYYSLNYIKKNRINRDTYALLFAIICLEVLIGFAIFKDRFTPMAYAAVCIIALIIPTIPFVIWTINPDKRVHANYSFKTSILNRFMLYLNLLVIVMLIGFFGLNANINNAESMVAPILIPALLLLNIPLSTVIYTILYKTKKYHIS